MTARRSPVILRGLRMLQDHDPSASVRPILRVEVYLTPDGRIEVVHAEPMLLQEPFPTRDPLAALEHAIAAKRDVDPDPERLELPARRLGNDERLHEQLGELNQREAELDAHEARVLAEIELREDEVTRREEAAAEREERLERKDQELRLYAVQLQAEAQRREARWAETSGRLRAV
jgi:hypothetical protein